MSRDVEDAAEALVCIQRRDSFVFAAAMVQKHQALLRLEESLRAKEAALDAREAWLGERVRAVDAFVRGMRESWARVVSKQ